MILPTAPEASGARWRSPLERRRPRWCGIEIVREGQPTSTASGVAIDTQGDVVTGADAVADAYALRIVLADARALPARLRGADPHSGVAVVQLERPPHDLAVARFADSDLVAVGEPMLAIARRADGAPSIGRGLVSRRQREPRATPISAAMGGRDSFSTDVPLDAENPGGALVNRDGEVVALAVGTHGLPDQPRATGRADDRGARRGALPVSRSSCWSTGRRTRARW